MHPKLWHWKDCKKIAVKKQNRDCPPCTMFPAIRKCSKMVLQFDKTKPRIVETPEQSIPFPRTGNRGTWTKGYKREKWQATSTLVWSFISRNSIIGYIAITATHSALWRHAPTDHCGYFNLVHDSSKNPITFGFIHSISQRHPTFYHIALKRRYTFEIMLRKTLKNDDSYYVEVFHKRL